MTTRNIEDLCRICVKESHSYKHIYSHPVVDSYLYEVMNALCSMNICPGDGLPQYICSDCYDKVVSFNRFKKTCHDGTAALVSIKMKYGSEETTFDLSKVKMEVFMDQIECDGNLSHRDDVLDDWNEDQKVEMTARLTPDDLVQGMRDEPCVRNDTTQLERIRNRHGVDVEGGDKVLVGFEGSRVIPVGLVKCPLDEMDIDDGRREVPIFGMERIVEERSKVTGDAVISGAKEDSRSRLNPHHETTLQNGVDDYRIGATRSPFVPDPSSELRQQNDDTSSRLKGPFQDQGEGFVIKRIYDGTLERDEEFQVGTGSFPNVGYIGERPRDGGYKCPHCAKVISRRFDFESHLRIHSGIKPFECEVCHATFNLKKRLKAHMNVHSAMKLFICAYCQRRFKCKDALRLHIYVHGGEKLPERPSKPSEVWCEICGVSVLKSCLAHHMRMHSRDLECGVCGVTCRDADELGAHKLMHEREKKFQCKECGKRYGLKGNLAQHMMTHSKEKRYSCLTCARKFYTASRLKRHELVHSSVRNVVCSACGRAFKSKDYLRQHLRTHQVGGALHKCATCGQKYKWQGDLKKHCRLKNH